jgi:hypothetical protein
MSTPRLNRRHTRHKASNSARLADGPVAETQGVKLPPAAEPPTFECEPERRRHALLMCRWPHAQRV